MKTSTELIDEHTNDDGTVDLDGVTRAMDAELGGSQVELSPMDVLMIQERHFDWAIRWVANLALSIAEDTNALPKGYEQELANVDMAMKFDKTRHVYDVVWTRENPLSSLILPTTEVPRDLT